jgi:two-component system, OmpR family, response regulator
MMKGGPTAALQNCHPPPLVRGRAFCYDGRMRVLFAEDERKIAGFVRKALLEQGFSVDVTGDGDEALYLATNQSYDVIVLDIMLPGHDGLSILRALRDRRNPVPVILATARTELDERLEGLNLGADDYITKPYFVEELVARIHAVSRRAGGEGLSILQSGDLVVDLIGHHARRGDQELELTSREFSLLEYLMRSPGKVFARTQILEHVWGLDFDPGSNLIDVYVQRLRRKIGPDAESQFIETVRGVGYRFRKA